MSSVPADAPKPALTPTPEEKKSQPSSVGEQAPANTFDKQDFSTLLTEYDHSARVPPTLELGQAFLMTSNMREAASQVSMHTPGGAGYFFQSDYVADTMRMADSFVQVGKMVANLGPWDKSSNFILEQRALMRAQAEEDKDIRDAIAREVSAKM